MTKKDLVIIPTYNEAINVRIIHSKIRENNQISDILFIDDNSPDNTADVISEIMKNDNKVYLLKRKKIRYWVGS